MTKPKNKKKWLKSLIETDFLRIKEDPEILEAMITPQKADLATINFGVISMIVSLPQGANYLSKHDKFLDRSYKMFKDSENGTVLQRFCLAVIQKMSNLEVAARFYFEHKFQYWIVDFLEDMDPKNIHSFIPIYLLSAFYNILCAEINENDIEENIFKYGKIMKRILKLFLKPLPGACYIAILEVIKHFQKTSSKWREMDLEGKVTDTLNEYLADVESLFKNVQVLDKFKDQIVDTMKLLAGDEKPIGYYEKKKTDGKEDMGEDGSDDEEKEKKRKKKKKKKSKKGKKKDGGKGLGDWRVEDIKLYRGVMKYLGDQGFEGESPKVEFEVFKDELNL